MGTKKTMKWAMTRAFIEHALDFDYFDDDGSFPEAPISCRYEPGDPASRLLLLTGENASGKSFFSSLFAAMAKKDEIQAFVISMNHRVSGYMKCMIYGGMESDTSTGHMSANVLLGGVRQCRIKEERHLIVWDEPDIGMSESYHEVMGRIIGELSATIPDKTVGLIVTTHSRKLAASMIEHAKLRPHHIRFGDEFTLEDWLAGRVPSKTIEDLENLPKVGNARRIKIEKLISRVKSS